MVFMGKNWTSTASCTINKIITVYGTYDSIIGQTTFSSGYSTFIGVHFHKDTGYCAIVNAWNVKFIGCTFEDFYCGVDINSHYCLIDGCHFYRVGESRTAIGIFHDIGEYCCISNNTFWMSNTGTSDAIFYYHGSQHNQVVGCTLVNNVGHLNRTTGTEYFSYCADGTGAFKIFNYTANITYTLCQLRLIPDANTNIVHGNLMQSGSYSLGANVENQADNYT